MRRSRGDAGACFHIARRTGGAPAQSHLAASAPGITPLPLSFSLAVKQSVIDTPGASATDSELRIALRMLALLSQLGFLADGDEAPKSGKSRNMVSAV